MPNDAFRVTVTCEDGVWTSVVVGVRGARTQARRLSELDRQVREQLAELLHRPASLFVLEYNLDRDGRH
jgi:hypothetical protein